MKQLLIFTISFVFLSGNLFSQCPTEDIILLEQNDVDQFIVKYPNCTEFNSSLTISGNTITNLKGLNNLAMIYQDLNIMETSLTDLNGLNQLTSISNSLRIVRNALLIDLSGLEGITTIAGDITIEENSVLTNFVGLSNLKEVYGMFTINSNSSLVNFTGLTNLTLVSEDFRISNNSSLESFVGMENLNKASNDLIINNNQSLLSLNGLENLNEVGYFLKIESNPNLNDINALSNLEKVRSGLILKNNNMLSDCSKICDLIMQQINEPNLVIGPNKMGCNNKAEVIDECNDLVSVNEVQFENTIKVFPSIIDDHLTIEGLVAGKRNEIMLYNNNGQLVHSENIYNRKIELSHLPEGYYTYTISSGNKLLKADKVLKW